MRINGSEASRDEERKVINRSEASHDATTSTGTRQANGD